MMDNVSSPNQANRLNLDQFVENVILLNPEIKRLNDQVQAQQSLLQNTGALPDPLLTYEGGLTTKFKLNQKLNNPFKVNVDLELAQADVDIVDLRLLSSIRALTFQAHRLYSKLCTIELMLDLTREEINVLDKMYQSSLRQYEVNKVSQLDPLAMSLMKSEVAIKLELQLQSRQSLLAEASRLMGGADPIFSFPKILAPRPLNITLSELQEIAKTTGNLDILIAQKEAQKAQKATEQTNGASLFEYEIGAGYDVSNETIEWMGGITLPWWSQKKDELYRYQDTLAYSALTQVEEITQRVHADITSLVYKIESADKILPIYEKDMIPKAKQSRNLAMMSYDAGQLSWNEWVVTEQRYLNIYSQYYQLLSDRLSDEADLEQLVGTWRWGYW